MIAGLIQAVILAVGQVEQDGLSFEILQQYIWCFDYLPERTLSRRAELVEAGV
jgi:hypothetical protein